MCFFPLILVQTVADFKADIQAAKAQGRRIGISVGGADTPIAVTATNNATFASSLLSIMDAYDFDGIDIDFEQGSVSSTDGVALAWAMRTVRSARLAKGKQCFFSMSPGMFLCLGNIVACTVLRNLTLSMYLFVEFPYLRSGMYVTLANTLINEWDFVSPQLYNQGGDGFWVNGIGMVSANMADLSIFIREFYKAFVDRAYAQFGVVFSQDQFVLGLPATNWAAGSGYIPPASIISGVSQLKAQSMCHSSCC